MHAYPGVLWIGSNMELHLDPALKPHVEVEAEMLLLTRVIADLNRFFSDPWWSHVWTLQEYRLCSRTTFQCGSFSLDRLVLESVLAVWYGHTEFLSPWQFVKKESQESSPTSKLA